MAGHSPQAATPSSPSDTAAVIGKAIVAGMLLVFAGSIPRNIIFAANTRLMPAVPWLVLPMAVYLWVYWRYVSGAWWPRPTTPDRRERLRANNLSGDVWFWSLAAGVTALVCLVLVLRVVNRLVSLPPQESPNLTALSTMTVISMILVGAFSAAIVEESSFRGYMQGPLERRVGITAAIGITGFMFGLAHLGITPILMPYYISVAALYGMITYLTDSILPSIVLHTAGNIFSNTFLWLRGHAEWQQSATPTPLIWETGTDASFWIYAIASAVTFGLVISVYRKLAKIAR